MGCGLAGTESREGRREVERGWATAASVGVVAILGSGRQLDGFSVDGGGIFPGSGRLGGISLLGMFPYCGPRALF